MRDFRSLLVWEKSHRLTLAVYKATSIFLDSERYGLTSQLRRSSCSIPANIAEGCGRNGNPDFARFMQIAMGSACELEYHLLLARDLKYVDPKEHKSLEGEVVEVKKMLASLIKKLKAES